MEIKGISKAQLASSFTDKVQELIILPTEKCNFRCTYCYEDFSVGKMKPHVVSAIKKLILKRSESIKELSISWFGGEPLLAQDICLDILEYASSLCSSKDIYFSSGFTTNGYFLSKELVEKLASYNAASFQVSLDGYGEGH